ncbi:MAG: hypothetical protein LC799_36085, partial [Actinobacteria bacterium]|nr:hypothetical protein [Actinomycetota bacterium]
MNRYPGHRRYRWCRRLRSHDLRDFCPANHYYLLNRRRGSHCLGNQCPWNRRRGNRDPDDYDEAQ